MRSVSLIAALRARLTLAHSALFLGLLLLAVRAFAGSLTLAWDPVSSPALTGYMLHYGPTAGSYTSKIDVGNTTTRTVANLTDGATYHFAVTAYDSNGTESGFSNDVTATVPWGAPIANFTASVTSGVAPLALNFTNTSTGNVSSYAWNFGDGTSSTSQSPSHVYSAPGSYTVSLTVTGSGGSNTKTLPNYINTTAPVTSDTSPPTAPGTLTASVAGTTAINLSWKSATDNVGVTGYRVERCQGTSCRSFVQIATVTGTTFSSTGLAAGISYSYRVRAADAAGNLGAYSNVATATTTSSVTAPVAAFSGSPTSGTAPLTVNFASSSTGTIATYAWNFGDGTSSSAQSPSHVYSAAGVYTVSLTVTNSAGSNTKTSTNYVTVTAPTIGGSLTGSWVATSNAANLTSVGSSDWVQWAQYVRHASGGGQISNLAMLNGGIAGNYSGDARTLSWSNGAPTASGSTNSGMYVSGNGKGFQFTVPADTSARTLTIYVGMQNTSGTLTAQLSDGSAANYVKTYSGSRYRTDGVFTLNYRAAKAGQTLTVKWVQSSSKRGGNVSMQGAALAVVGGTTTPPPPPPPPSSSCPCSLWSDSAVPTVAADSDTSPVELGVKFKSDVAGYITGVRFFKSSANTGTHVGSLWSANGTLLARGTFTNETASGWQQLTFSTPVAITANTVYVASYHTDVGRYAGDNGYFATAGVDNGPLHALKDGISGGNGVYAYGSTPVFPTLTYNASNYWVDVMFSPIN
jgi:PKD repeat protein